jgi:hypothetical protein
MVLDKVVVISDKVPVPVGQSYCHKIMWRALQPDDFGIPMTRASFALQWDTQPPLLQRRADRRLAVPFTERLTLDMWVRHIVMAGGYVRFERDDFVWPLLIEPIPIQHDLKGAEVDLFQGDRVGHHGDGVLFEVAVKFAELGLQGIEFVLGLPQIQGRLSRSVGQVVDVAATVLEVSRKQTDRPFELPD